MYEHVQTLSNCIIITNYISYFLNRPQSHTRALSYKPNCLVQLSIYEVMYGIVQHCMKGSIRVANSLVTPTALYIRLILFTSQRSCPNASVLSKTASEKLISNTQKIIVYK